MESTVSESTLPKVKSLSVFFSPSLERTQENENWETVKKNYSRLNFSTIDYILIPNENDYRKPKKCSLFIQLLDLSFFVLHREVPYILVNSRPRIGEGGGSSQIDYNFFFTAYNEYQIEIMKKRQNNS